MKPDRKPDKGWTKAGQGYVMEFSIDSKGLANLKKKLDPKIVAKAEVRALNKAAKKGRTAQSKEIRRIYNITAKRLDIELLKVSGNSLATTKNTRAIITAKKIRKGNPGLQNYSTTKVKTGTSYKIRKDKKRMTRRHAFDPGVRRTTGIYLRKGEKRIMTRGTYKGKLRQPIIRQTGPSVTQMMKRVGVTPIKKSVKENFSGLFEHELRRELARTKR